MLLKLENISHSYQDGRAQRLVLSNFSLLADSGEFIGLKGPSGSGKSTLLNILGLVLKASAGSYSFSGTDVFKLNSSEQAEYRRSKIGYVFQHFYLLAGLNALENVMLSALLAGNIAKEARLCALSLLKTCGLEKHVNQFPGALSGGERQRVALCRALVAKPRLILADEPSGSLDHESAEPVLNLLKQAADKGTCVIMASHSEQALKLCQRVLPLST